MSRVVQLLGANTSNTLIPESVLYTGMRYISNLNRYVYE